MGTPILSARSSLWKIHGPMFGAIVILVMLFSALLASPAQAAGVSPEEAAFVQLLNQYRVDNGLQPLLVSDMISEACDRHNSDMGKYRFFDHYTAGSDWFPVGASPWDRMAASGYTYNTYKGENIAAGYSTATAVFQAWKNSPGHNANMLGPNFAVLGVSMLYVAGSAYGYYWTTDFGGYVDSTAHSVGSVPTTTTTTAAPTTTTTTAAPTTTTTTWSTTTTTTRPPVITTTTVATPPVTTTTTPASTTTTTVRPTTTTSVPPPEPVFADVDVDTLYASEIGLMVASGVISGYGDGTFGPGDPVTRQQFAKMIMLALGYSVSPLSASAFTDVETQLGTADPLYPGSYIAACAAAGITLGKTPDIYGPYDHITRAQLITMVSRAAHLADPPLGYRPPFKDFLSDHYLWATRAAFAGLLDGLVDMGSNFDFWAPATRGEVCLLLANLLDR